MRTSDVWERNELRHGDEREKIGRGLPDGLSDLFPSSTNKYCAIKTLEKSWLQ